jgi:hypothetical protein
MLPAPEAPDEPLCYLLLSKRREPHACRYSSSAEQFRPARSCGLCAGSSRAARYPLSCGNSLARPRLRHFDFGRGEHLQLQRDLFPFGGYDVLRSRSGRENWFQDFTAFAILASAIFAVRACRREHRGKRSRMFIHFNIVNIGATLTMGG